MYKNKIKYNSNIVAVKDNDLSFTYNELYNNSLKINNIKDKVIGIYINKSSYYIQAIYYAFLSEITFVPLNPTLPKERIDFIIKDSGIETILKTRDLNINFEKSINIEDLIESTNPSVDFNSNRQKEKYIIYTSGTTGNPKGCILSDRGIDNVISQQIEIFEMNNSNIFLYLSINFDASLSDILCSFYSESTLFINDNILKDKNKIINYFNKNNITHVDMPPSFLSFFKKEDLPTLKNIVIGGENASKIDAFPRVVNVYGPTEATICTSYEVIDKEFKSNCIGKPLNNVEYKIIDNILHIKSIQLFEGYKNMYNPIVDGWYNTGDIVEEKNGKFYFIGRKDNQIKHNGNMINLDEIENKIKTINPISFIKYEKKEIILYTNKKIERDVLERILPSYMIPHKQYINSEGLADKTRKKEFILKGKIYNIFKEYTNYELSLKELGIDSLKLIEYSIELSNIGVNVPYENLINMTISEINSKDRSLYTEKELSKMIPKIELEKTIKGKETLVVGASGFLGVHLVKELVDDLKEKGDSSKDILCLVRSIRKFYEIRDYYKLKIDDSYLILYEGDLTKDNLGLLPNVNNESYDFLKNNVGTIYFMAGEVNNIKNLNDLWESNILTVQNILKFKGIDKDLIFASTLSVKVSVENKGRIIGKELLIPSDNKVLTGYAQSKWIADRMVSDTPNTYIMRYGMLLHDIMPYNSFYTMLLNEISESKRVPEDKGYSMDNTSVIFAAKETISKRETINNITENKKIFYKDLIKNKMIGENRLIEKFIEEGNVMNVFETTNIINFKK